MNEPLSPLAKIVFKFINALPWFFPKRHRWQAKHYLTNYADYVFDTDARFDKGSILAGDFTWKGLSFLIPFDHQQLSVVTR